VQRATDIPNLPPRRPDSHKGDYGRILVIGGSEGMIGAPCLAALAALRTGAGLVTLAVARSLLPVVAVKLTSALTRAIEAETPNGAPALDAVGELLDFAAGADVVALGPGIGRHYSTQRFVHAFLKSCEKPAVVDADALTALASGQATLRDRPAPTILTPHPGEMARLCGKTAADVNADRVNVAAAFAAGHRCVVALKGHGTVVTDGERVYVNQTGNPGMATGGSGDVLTGAVAALLGRGLEPFDAAVLGVHLHGEAGDLAREKKGEDGMIASDILRALPAAMRDYRAGQS